MTVDPVISQHHPADVVWGDEAAARVERPGYWTYSEGVSILRRRFESPWIPDSESLIAVVSWVRRDLVDLDATRNTDPDRHYAAVASRAVGEPIFLHGRAGLIALGYEPLIQTLVRADANGWAIDRFLGLGCPWRFGLPQVGDRVIDIGSGAGIDTTIAAHAVGAKGIALGVDLRSALLGQRWLRRRVLLVQASATECPVRSDSMTMAVANGLPPLMSFRSAPAALAEVRRILAPGGELRFTTLISGEPQLIEELSDLDVLNAVRTGKPPVDSYRRLLHHEGFASVDVALGPEPFVPSYRSQPVNAACFRARIA